MTLVVGVNLGSYALLAADSGLVVSGPHRRTHRIDGAERVFRTPVGLASGCGVWQMVTDAMDCIGRHPEVINAPKALAEFLEGYCSCGWAASSGHDELGQHGVPKAGWMLTSAEHNRVSVRCYLEEYYFQPIEAPEGVPFVLLPPDITGDDSSPFEDELVASLRPARSAQDVDDTLEHNLAAVTRFVGLLASISEVLGESLQVGCHVSHGEIDISELLPLARCRAPGRSAASRATQAPAASISSSPNTWMPRRASSAA